ncbi:MAG: hypothetical protein JHC26_04450 [Thermofilum sp.]|jgi:hypothetical protein|uniref:hypothetical protein n=1 Tax=Thermofilum sp. TaxID=1961369 RepID=UPI00258FA4A0|nr:hypothetical protein [Thermofilum sp.]MCI4408318.1 hypothetical protein [Thermofilum sp.]
MNRTEIVVKVMHYGRHERVFREWLHGWLQLKGYNIVDVREKDEFYLVYEIEGNMFELFEDIYEEIRFMKRRLGIDGIVAICSGDECIDLTGEFDMVVLSDGDLEKLRKVVEKLGCVVGSDNVEGIWVFGRKGYVVLALDGCVVRLRVDEAFMFAAGLVGYTVNRLRLGILSEVKVVRDIFESVVDMDVDYMGADDECVDIFVGDCKKRLTPGNVLRLAYQIMKVALEQLKTWREEGQ